LLARLLVHARQHARGTPRLPIRPLRSMARQAPITSAVSEALAAGAKRPARNECARRRGQRALGQVGADGSVDARRAAAVGGVTIAVHDLRHRSRSMSSASASPAACSGMSCCGVGSLPVDGGARWRRTSPRPAPCRSGPLRAARRTPSPTRRVVDTRRWPCPAPTLSRGKTGPALDATARGSVVRGPAPHRSPVGATSLQPASRSSNVAHDPAHRPLNRAGNY
jgi:hypothetical protein